MTESMSHEIGHLCVYVCYMWLVANLKPKMDLCMVCIDGWVR